jgi:anti-anti-sigma factor
MSALHAQIWKGSSFTIERNQDPVTDAVVFHFSGPFTARDMYSSLTPIDLRNLFESHPPHHPPTVHIFDLAKVPYIDSCGLGLIIGQFVRCQNNSLRFIVAGITPRTLSLFQITKTDRLFPITGTVDEALALAAVRADVQS